MRVTFDERIARAGELAQTCPAARDVLNFYRRLALFQKPVYEDVKSSGETDVRGLLRYFPALIDLVRRAAPDPLVHFAGQHLGSRAAQEELLVRYWDGGGDSPADPHNGTPLHPVGAPRSEAACFFARVLLQPYAECLAARGNISFQSSTPTCPFCNGKPVVAVLRGEGDGAKRWLLCSTCATEWPFRRVVCPNCGEENKDELPVYKASEFDHVRVEACDHCQTYIKSVDLSRNGRAVPVVDELATLALNIWADENGYTKFESNLLGL